MYCENFKISSSTWATHFLSLNNVTVDPESYRVEVDGVHLTCAPATEVPLAQRYFLF